MIECTYKHIRYKKTFYNNALRMYTQEVHTPKSLYNNKINEDISNKKLLITSKETN
jgi:hypothetical protein